MQPTKAQSVKAHLEEDILGTFGFRVVWDYLDHWCDFKVYNIVSRGENDEAEFETGVDGDFSADHTQVTPYLAGVIKWDGCSHVWTEEATHICGGDAWRKHIQLYKHLYYRAFELMGLTPDEPLGEC